MRVDDPKLEMPGTPVILVAFVSTPEGARTPIFSGGLSVAATLAAPKEVLRIRSYENVDPTLRPQSLTVFEFASFLDAATYLNRPEIAAHYGSPTELQRGDRQHVYPAFRLFQRDPSGRRCVADKKHFAD